MGSACYPIRQATGENIVPAPFNQFPTFSSAILWARRSLGSRRIHSIEYVGPDQVRTLREAGRLSALDAAFFGLGSVFTGGAIFIATRSAEGVYEYYIVPVESTR
jgi:hypothetical protein